MNIDVYSNHHRPMKNLLNLSIACLLSAALYAQDAPPANDDYTSAVELTANPAYTCYNPVSGTTVGATRSPQIAFYNGLNYHDDDVWYSFTATHWSHLVKLSDFTAVEGTGTSRFIEILEEGIDVVIIEEEEVPVSVPKTRLYWSNEVSAVTEKTLTHLTINKKYYVRVYSSGTAARITFDICLLTPPSPPVNDEFTGALELPVNPAYECTQNLTGNTTDGAGQSSQEAYYNNLNYHDDDVWFRFTATSPAHLVKISNVGAVYGSGTSRFIEIFEEGLDMEIIEGEEVPVPVPKTRLYWSNESSAVTEKNLTDLTIGKTYYVRVYSSGTVTRITFDICLLTPPSAPANDEFTGALELPVNPAYECTQSLTGNTTDGAGQSSQEAYYNSLNYHDDDIWFKFTAVNASQIVRLSDIVAVYGSGTSHAIEIFGENEGETLTPRIDYHSSSSAAASEVLLTGLTPEKTYYIRVYSFHTITRISFTLCVATPAAPPNDECASATDISGGGPATGTTAGASESMAAGQCADGNAYDVWYKVTPASAGDLIVTANSTDFDLVLEAYAGNCGELIPVMCKNESSGSESMTIADAVAGTTYYFRVYNHTPVSARTAAETGTFTIQATGGALPVTLVSFGVSVEERGNVRLDWATTGEANSSHFEIEHRTAESSWIPVGRVKASISSTGLRSYYHIHVNPSSSVHYYRLKMVDLDGSYAYSGIRHADLTGIAANPVAVYPNPAGEYIMLDRLDRSGVSSLRLLNMSGAEVPFKEDRTSGLVYTGHLPAGVYLLHINRNHSPGQVLRIVIRK